MAQRYYTDKLAAERLMRCYAIAPPAARAYLQGEIDFVLAELSAVEWAQSAPRPGAPRSSESQPGAPGPGLSRGRILELGCGFGRVLRPLLERGGHVWGIDTSLASLEMARKSAGGGDRLHLAAMDAVGLAFADEGFDAVLCIQNGISAFAVDPLALMREALRVTRPGGRIFFSSYAERFWPERLRWFEAQAAEGLVGEIDRAATGQGVIECKDGFRGRTFGPGDFRRLSDALGVAPRIEEVGGSSLFCVCTAPSERRFER